MENIGIEKQKWERNFGRQMNWSNDQLGEKEEEKKAKNWRVEMIAS